MAAANLRESAADAAITQPAGRNDEFEAIGAHVGFGTDRSLIRIEAADALTRRRAATCRS